VGNRVIAPVLANYMELFSTPALKVIINPLSIAIAFGLIFLLNKIIFSFLISIINRIIEKGIAEKVDSAIGLVFAGTVAFLSVATIVSVSQYLLIDNEFFGAVRSLGFSGGPLYKFFVSLSL
jgi:succinate-acetate transporter protein